MKEIVFRKIFDFSNKEIYNDLNNNLNNNNDPISITRKANLFRGDIPKNVFHNINQNKNPEIFNPQSISNDIELSNYSNCYKNSPQTDLKSSCFHNSIPNKISGPQVNEKIVNYETSSKNQSTKKIIKNNNGEYFFSHTESFLLLFLKCFASKRQKNLNEHFLKLIDYVEDYIDILEIVKNINDVKKLKFVIFNLPQLSYFESSNFDFPFKKLQNYKVNKITEYNRFIKDTKNIQSLVEEFLNTHKVPKEGELDDFLNQKLINLFSK